jgi:LysR family transcriptional regulator of beta-lactamase
MDAALSPVCAPAIGERLGEPADLMNEELLRSYRRDEWPQWFRAACVKLPTLRGPMFDTSLALVAAAARGAGVALVPVSMFVSEIEEGRVVQPFDITVSVGSYWLTHLKSRTETPSMAAFQKWIVAEVGRQSSSGSGPAKKRLRRRPKEKAQASTKLASKGVSSAPSV